MRPVIYVIGMLVAFVGATMLLPMVLDLADGNRNWQAFLTSGCALMLVGTTLALSTRNALGRSITLRQSFLLTSLTWTVVPLAGAVPFIVGLPHASFTDAYFESMSGLTTTGASVFLKLGEMPRGVLLWRGMLNWMGGLGIVIVIMIFLPVMKVGGMQFFRAEGFDTLGKVLPRARDIAMSLLAVYAALTVAAMIGYAMVGVPAFDAVVHGLSSIATGGFSTRDASFFDFTGGPEYVGALFMFLASLPYVRYVQLVTGRPAAFFRDSQILAYTRYVLVAVVLIVAYRLWHEDAGFESILRNTLFNVIAVISSTGYASAYLPDWGAFPLLVVFVIGVIGACTGSSAAGLGVFRVQIMFGAVLAVIRRILSPNRVLAIRYAGRAVDEDVLFQIMAFFATYIVTMGIFTVLATSTGIDFGTALFSIWTAIGNIGVSVGDGVKATGTMVDLPAFVKWLMIVAMMLGRLGILSVLVLFLPRFWRD
ncbi:MAG: TrkH family potassium uptake protein [Paracoccaceae bacterium]